MQLYNPILQYLKSGKIYVYILPIMPRTTNAFTERFPYGMATGPPVTALTMTPDLLPKVR